MNFLLNSPIRNRLLLNSALSVLIFLTALSIYNFSLTRIDADFQNILAEDANISHQILLVTNLMVECRKNEKDFLLHKNESYSNLAQKNIDRILQKTDEIKIFAEKQGAMEIVLLCDRITENTAAYKAILSKVVASHIKKGLTPNDGFQGDFRNIAHELFNVHIQEHAVTDLLISLLKMKNYLSEQLSNRMEIDQNKFAKMFSSFSNMLQKHPMRSVYKDNLPEKLKTLHKHLNDYFAEKDPVVKKNHQTSLRQSIDEILSGLEAIYVSEIRFLVLQIRRHEKDYLLRGDLLYVQKVHQAVKDLQEAIRSTDMAEEDLTGTLQYLHNYQVNFDRLVEEDRKLNILQHQLDDRAQEVEKVGNAIISKSKTRAEKTLHEIDLRAKKTTRISLIVCFIILICVILLSRVINKSIVTPLYAIMKGISEMTEGDYQTRISYNQQDKTETGILAARFNLMAETIEKNNWFFTGRNRLAKILREEKDETLLCREIITFLANFLQAQIGAVYVLQEDQHFYLIDSYSFPEPNLLQGKIKLGVGMIGEAARSQQLLVLAEIPQNYLKIQSSLGEVIPKNILIVPAVWENTTQAVIELATIETFSEQDIKFIKLMAESIAIALYSTRQRYNTEKLLEKTQVQAEELQVQQEELKTANEELEEQTISLKQSEEELKSQQEELQVSNEELEEKAESLEQQNLKIKEKNRELKKAWADIEKKAEELAEANRYKSEFLANMSHELRTPLNSLLLLARNLAKNKDGNLNESQVESAEVIYHSGEDLLALINDILDLSKIEAGYMETEVNQIGVRGFGDWLTSNFQHVADEKNIRFSVTIHSDFPKTLTTDRHRLEQIMRNLITNALKFTHEGEVAVTFHLPNKNITLSKCHLETDKAVAITVSDTGIGISPEKQHMVFDAFKQVEGGTNRKYGGTGLGLSISRELAGLLNGEIQLVSEKEKGSSFTLYLPLQLQKDSLPAPEAETDPSHLPDPQPSRPTMRFSVPDDRENLQKDDKVILIIEDDPHFIKILIDLGRKKGFKCIASTTGSDGLELVEQYNPGAIILDIRLPDIDGWQVLDSLKKKSSLRHIPVHMVSGEEKTIEAFKKGAIGFLTKPLSEEDMHEAFIRLEDAFSQRMKNLLVIDDDEVTLAEIIKIIGNNDVTTTTAHNGAQALEILKNRKIDCMILDIGLPDMTGFELLETLESITDVKIPPVIIYTGRELTVEEGASLQKYTDTVIIKGVKSEERLLDETSLFLHRVIKNMPAEKRKMIASLYDQDAMFMDKHILIVDDDMRNAFALSKILEERGMKIFIAHDGVHALKVLSDQPGIHLVLMDIMMPVMDGFETIKRIRKNEAFWNLPIIALTAKAMSEDKEKCMTVGANDYLAKPVEEGRLLSMMRVWLYR